ncbi:hypothetical protein EUX98_g9716, partial [Antrodiella citrinella]
MDTSQRNLTSAHSKSQLAKSDESAVQIGLLQGEGLENGDGKDEDDNEDGSDDDEESDDEDEDEDTESEDDSVSFDDVDGEEVIRNTLHNLREKNGLAALLDDKWKSSASFSFRQTYKTAPNPALELEDIGNVGLPLSERDAKIIKIHPTQAPFGMGERTVVDKSVRDTWELDAELVAFGNLDWEEFMAGVVKEVCTTLGVTVSASKPHYELYKLLLHETGSHFLPHVDTEKAECDVMVYTDVTHEIKPITSGYRLALAYNLLHTNTSLRPAISNDEGFTSGYLPGYLKGL